jgi:hypothetical protein
MHMHTIKHHYNATGTLDADVCAAACASGSLRRIKQRTRFMHACIMHCIQFTDPISLTHCFLRRSKRPLQSAGIGQGLLFHLQRKSRNLGALQPHTNRSVRLRRNQLIMHGNHVLLEINVVQEVSERKSTEQSITCPPTQYTKLRTAKKADVYTRTTPSFILYLIL